MAYVAVDKEADENDEIIFVEKIWDSEFQAKKYNFGYEYNYTMIELPEGSIEKLIGKKLTWEDEPVELKEQK